MKNKEKNGDFGMFHFIKRKRQHVAYDMATAVQIELEKVITPFKNDIGYTYANLVKMQNLEHEVEHLKMKIKDKDSQIEILKTQLNDALKSVEESKANQEKLNEYLNKVVEIVKQTNEKLLERNGKVTRVSPDRAKSSQKIGLKSCAITSKIIKKVKEN